LLNLINDIACNLLPQFYRLDNAYSFYSVNTVYVNKTVPTNEPVILLFYVRVKYDMERFFIYFLFFLDSLFGLKEQII